MRLIRLFALSLLAVIFAAAPAAAQTADDLFRGDVLHELHVSMSSRDFQQLILRYEENTFYPADLKFGELRYRNAGVRVRGRSSRVQGKPGLELQFGRYVTNGRFLGLDTLVLDNLWQDTGMVSESISMAMFNRMGIAAPRESFCRLYINNLFYGVYGILEQPDKSFLERRFEDGNGVLFEFHPNDPFNGEDLGDDLAAYKPYFEPRTHRLDADSTLYAPIRDLFKEVNSEMDGVWRERVERLIDVPQFVRYVAVETFVAEPDGILGSNGMSNFYLYRRADSPQQRLVPWDKDLSFDNPEYDLFRRADQNQIFRRLITFPDLLALYLQSLEECARSAAAEGWLQQEVERVTALVADAAHEDDRKSALNEELDARVDYLRGFAASRSDYVLRAVEDARRALLR